MIDIPSIHRAPIIAVDNLAAHVTREGDGNLAEAVIAVGGVTVREQNGGERYRTGNDLPHLQVLL